jgi:hypothetical protein
MSYFETQCGKLCSIHAMNNALGYKKFTQQEVIDFINIYIEDKVEKYRRDKEKYRLFLTTELYGEKGISLDIIFLMAKNNGIEFVPVIDITNFSQLEKSRTYIIGTKKGIYNHAIVYKNGYIYDSEFSGPKKMSETEFNKIYTILFIRVKAI